MPFGNIIFITVRFRIKKITEEFAISRGCSYVVKNFSEKFYGMSKWVVRLEIFEPELIKIKNFYKILQIECLCEIISAIG